MVLNKPLAHDFPLMTELSKLSWLHLVALIVVGFENACCSWDRSSQVFLCNHRGFFRSCGRRLHALQNLLANIPLRDA